MSRTPDPARRREERSRHAVAAAVSLAREHGLRVEEPAVLADLFSVMVHLRPAPVVARVSTGTATVRTPIEDWLGREVAVASFLAGQGAPVAAPSRELPPGPHAHQGFAISFWSHVEADPDRTPSMADCSAMLVDLHAVLRDYPGELPLLAPVVNDIPWGLDALLRRHPDVLSGEQANRVHAAVRRLRPFVDAPTGDIQPLHGDVHPGNLIATRDGLVWIDFEDVCRGPVEWDLAMLPWIDPDAVTEHHRCDAATLARCSQLRALHLALCLIGFRDDFGDLPDWDEHIRGFVARLPPG